MRFSGRSAHLLVETQGPQERVHVVELCVAEALQALWVAGFPGESDSTDLEVKDSGSVNDITVGLGHVANTQCYYSIVRILMFVFLSNLWQKNFLRDE